MLAPLNPRSRKTLRAASRMRASTSPASSFGGRPKRTAARFAFAAGVFFKLLVFIAIDPGSVPLMVGGASQFMQITSACKENETVSFLLTGRSGRVIWPIETERFRFFWREPRGPRLTAGAAFMFEDNVLERDGLVLEG